MTTHKGIGGKPFLSFATTLGLMMGSPARSAVFEVGDGWLYPSIGSVPWESLQAGDTVLIHWRAAPYREKWVIGRQGTADAPITVRGVSGPGGERPVIDGEDATTRLQLDYWNENRSVIKIGGSSIPPDVWPRFVILENLDVRGARPPNTFTDDQGIVRTYSPNAAAIHLERGRDVIVRGCVIRDSGNGLFVSSSDDETARDITVEGNFIHGNGNVDSLYEHNVYTAAIGMTFQWNRFGPLQAGADGNNLKDRSAGLVVRYNWLEGGNRQLDLVDAEDSVLIRADPSYGRTYVYGNLLIEPAGAGNKQITHYGGDSGTIAGYRKGLLHFYHNTVVSLRTDGTTLWRLSTNDEHCDARNNVFYVTAAGNALALLDEDGILDLSHNWLKPGWVDSFSPLGGTVNDDGTSVVGSSPGFLDGPSQDYHLAPGSGCINAATGLHPDVLPDHDVVGQYVLHASIAARLVYGVARDIGAYEFLPADADGDADVDLLDYGAFYDCRTNPGGGVSQACRVFDIDLDGDADLADFRTLAQVFTQP